ncbi:hypothetical protein WICMUC_001300 [Wickerhamomyces mucosus]|uniref:Uncharacterized protein n=1 Tax=Wickerhamomyces mucosus TaxID=1378264 RepID=A0A9P8PVA9_9ASCO|nr:hypothetical protein WICMUC_001300 [Wickerhamomyces mucosus]
MHRLTSSHLKQLQKELNNHLLTSSVMKNSLEPLKYATLSDVRVDELLFHGNEKVVFYHDEENFENNIFDEISADNSPSSINIDKEKVDEECDINRALNSSLVIDPIEIDRTEISNNFTTTTFQIDETQLQNVKVHVRNRNNDLSQIFDPDNTSLLLIDKDRLHEEIKNYESKSRIEDKITPDVKSLGSFKTLKASNIKRGSNPTLRSTNYAKTKIPKPLQISKLPSTSKSLVKTSLNLRFPKLDI